MLLSWHTVWAQFTDVPLVNILKGFEMMRYLVVLAITAVAFASGGDLKKVDLTVTGMHCNNCTDRVKSALTKVQDVQGVEVDLKEGTAEVELVSSSSTTPHMLAEAIADAGYGVTYNDGNETKTVEATKAHTEDKDCVKDGSKMDCPKGAKADCCTGKSAKAKVIKKK